MKLEQAMAYWRFGKEAGDAAGGRGMLLDLVKREAREFDDSIRRRDRREIVAAVLIFPVFAFLLAHPSWVTRAGAMLVLAGCVITFLRLRGARSSQSAALVAEPLAVVLRAERERVEAQIRLLSSALWWYITPLMAGVVLVMAGMAGLSWITLAYTAAVIVFSIFIYRLNQAALRDVFVPRRDELARLLHAVEDRER